MKGFSGFKKSGCECVGKCNCSSPAKHRIGKHPAKDGHIKSDHKERRKEKRNERKKNKALSKFPYSYVESTTKETKTDWTKPVSEGGDVADFHRTWKWKDK